MNTLKRRLHLVFFALVLSVLATPLLLSLFNGEGSRLGAQVAGRLTTLRAQPKATLQAVDALVTQGYSLRAQVVETFNYLRLRVFASPSVSVVVGKGDWLFYTGNGTFEDYSGRLRFSQAELAVWTEALRVRRAWLASKGVKHLLVIVPNKNSVCEDRLPALLRLQHRPGRLDQLTEALAARHLDDGVLSLKPSLIAQYNREGPNYWPTDSHWNARGLLLACDLIMERLVALGISRVAGDYQDCVGVRTVSRQGDCVNILQMHRLWPAMDFSEVTMRDWKDIRTTTTPLSAVPPFVQSPPEARPVALERPSGQGRVVLLCDSFFRVGGMDPDLHARLPLGIHLRRLVSYWNWFDTENKASFDCLSRIVELEHPDIVIETTTERYLGTPPPDLDRFRAALQKQGQGH